MKTTTTEYLIKVKSIEKSVLEKLTAKIQYELKYSRKKKAKSIIYVVIRGDIERSYEFGFKFGVLIGKRTKELIGKVDSKDIGKYIKKDSGKSNPQKYRLTRKLVFDSAMKEIDIERDRFFRLYNLKVSTYLRDGYSQNRARTNIAVMKLENEIINKVRRVVSNMIYLNAQIGQVDGMKKELK
jgi:hypothetical protein